MIYMYQTLLYTRLLYIMTCDDYIHDCGIIETLHLVVYALQL